MTMTLTANVDIGSLSELKIKKIQENFKEEFPNGLINPNQAVIAKNNEQIILSPTQIQYTILHDEIKSIYCNLKKIQDILMLDNFLNNTIMSFIDIKELEKNCMEYTKEKFKPLITGVVGIGIREFFMYEKKLSEFKIEPFISDNTKLYLEARYHLGEIEIDSLENVIKSALDDYNSKRIEVYSKLNLD